jgi:hypothetical protein
MDIEGFHKCDDGCNCPHHGTRMYYASRHKTHACQDPECEYASGYEDVLIQKLYQRRSR